MERRENKKEWNGKSQPVAKEALPEEIISGKPTQKREVQENERATFVTLSAAGKAHCIQLHHTEEEQMQVGGEKLPRWVPKRGTGVKVRFQEGTFITDSEEVIQQLIYGNVGFGRDFDINRHDPTGYWRKNAKKYQLDFSVQEVFSIKGSPTSGPALVHGAATDAGAVAR